MSKLSNKAVVTIAFLAVITGLLLLSYDYLKTKKDLAYEKIRVSLFVEKENKVQNNVPEIVDETEEEPEPFDIGDYLGVLIIDKINLSQGFYNKDNPDNNVSKNLTFLEPSNYPDEKNGNVILVAHSGSSHIAYFKNLYQLEVGDKAIVKYKGKTYTYKVDNIYNEIKDGDVTIYRDTNRNTLTMITCTKNDDTKQTIYISYLESVK